MKIKIDMRETDLIGLMKENIANDKVFKELSAGGTVELVVENLPLGDIILTDASGEKDLVVIERKSLTDLMASIKDGRYEEQSYRLNHLEEVPNHNIIYLVEGDFSASVDEFKPGFGKINTFSKYKKFNNTKNSRFSDTEKCMLYSAMFSVLFYKGFSVFRTSSLKDTAFFLCNTACKLVREEAAGLKRQYYTNVLNTNVENNLVEEEKDNVNLEEENKTTAVTSKSYSHVVKKVKKDNITPENIGEIMLCQIPGISAVTATAIMNKYKSIPLLLACMKENPECLKEVTYLNDKSQTRKLNKTVVENISKYLGGI